MDNNIKISSSKVCDMCLSKHIHGYEYNYYSNVNKCTRYNLCKKCFFHESQNSETNYIQYNDIIGNLYTTVSYKKIEDVIKAINLIKFIK